MRKVEIGIPDDGWFSGDSEIRPQDKQLCFIIAGNYMPEVGMYDKKFDRFLRVNMTEIIRNINENAQHYSAWACGFDIDRWKPLGLPADVEERVLAEIEKWFEGE